ncbi:MAG: hypothetical protein ACKVOK_09320 [Flavobacteriales bacterium]
MKIDLRLITKVFCSLTLAGLSYTAIGQIVNEEWKDSRWSMRLGFGLNSFHSNGIPKSRNQINYDAAHSEAPSNYRQEDRIAGVCYESSLHYQLSRNGNLGLSINVYKDDSEYLYSADRSYNPAAIEADSLKSLSISNFQSYLNLGLVYEHVVVRSKSGRHRMYAGLTSGWSITRTPDRSEYDYYDEANFVAADTVGGNVWRLTHTHFNDGFFIAPSIAYGFSFRNGHSARFSLSEMLQWHSTEGVVKISGQNSGGSLENKRYSVMAFQFKFGYSF